MLEKDIEAKVSAHCLEEGILQQKFKGRKGCSDRIYFLHGGCAVLIEFKKPGGRTTRLQKNNHDNLRQRGHRVYTCKTSEDAINILNFWCGQLRLTYSTSKFLEGEKRLEKLRKSKTKNKYN